jgi:hypothetical protein
MSGKTIVSNPDNVRQSEDAINDRQYRADRRRNSTLAAGAGQDAQESAAMPMELGHILGGGQLAVGVPPMQTGLDGRWGPAARQPRGHDRGEGEKVKGEKF